MRTIHRSRFQFATTDASGRRGPRREQESARRGNPRRISEAVVASYLHDISQRHRPVVAAQTNRPHTASEPTPEVAR